MFSLIDLPFIDYRNKKSLQLIDNSDWQWNYWNSAFFAISVVTTIGYGTFLMGRPRKHE